MAERATPFPIPEDDNPNKVSIDVNGTITGTCTFNNGGNLKIDVDQYPTGYNQCQVSVTFVGWANSANIKNVPGGTIKVGS
ncbi:MAG TPA: hypothetical protein VHR84_06540 [Terriglobales bacterium]|jgi:hypothetical protein|nr:hypothetical protein [Terriglobales bacterium]